MVIFWIAAAALALCTAALVLWPLTRKFEANPREINPDAAIYRNQLDELERDVVAGAIGPEEATAARAEISRRLLGATEEDLSSSVGLTSRQRLVAVLLVVLAMPAFATLVYLQKGSPNYESQPYTDQNGEAELWIQYGRAYMQTEQFEDAEGAFLKAIELSEPRADLYEFLGEAIIFSGNGSIPDRAIIVFNKALELDPTRERSRYIIAEWQYRRGDHDTGVRAFVDLLEDTKDESLRQFLKERIDSALAEMRVEAEGGSSSTRPEHKELSDPLAGMSEADRSRIVQMVASLAARLEEEPDNLQGWLQLIRSYTVLRETDKARAALESATFEFLTQPEALEKILALAEELELVKGPALPPGAEGLAPP